MDTKLKFAISAIIFAAVYLSSYSNDISSFFTSINSNTDTTNNANSNVNDTKTLRIGYFPNVNHAQAVIGLNNGDFQKYFGDSTKVGSQVFNSGPSAIDALFSGKIDIAYVGPNPAINGYLASGGDLKIISGSANGGSVFVVRTDSGIASVKDFANKKFASPQLGNPQDVSLRKFLSENGYNTSENGGNVTLVADTPSNILDLMVKKEIDGAWVPEPWGAKLVKEAKGIIFSDKNAPLDNENEMVSTNIVTKKEFLENNPEITNQFIAAHVNETDWINQNKEEAIQLFNIALQNITGNTIPDDELLDALSRIEFTHNPNSESLFTLANDSYKMGFLAKGKSSPPDLSGIHDLTILNSILEKQGRATITSSP